MSDKRQWYPVVTNPRAEKKAHELLEKKGIESYLPLKKTLKYWSDRKKWVYEPLIKSYLFVNISEREITEVLMTRGVARFIYFSGRKASMPESQIRELKLLLASEAEFEVTEREFKKGQRVRVAAGPLKDITGELIDFQSQKKLVIRIGDTGQSILVQVSSNVLEIL